jgi:hypothetical protein
MRGRIMSIYQLLFAGTTPIGGTLIGYLADTRGVGAAIEIGAILCVGGLAAGVLYLRFGPQPEPPPTMQQPETLAPAP